MRAYILEYDHARQIIIPIESEDGIVVFRKDVEELQEKYKKCLNLLQKMTQLNQEKINFEKEVEKHLISEGFKVSEKEMLKRRFINDYWKNKEQEGLASGIGAAFCNVELNKLLREKGFL